MQSITRVLANDHARVTAALLFAFALTLVASTLIDTARGLSGQAQATSTATTTVTVLNTPPAWDITARELYASATNTPTNSGTSTVWTAQATDSNSENWYLLICKSSSTPTPGASGGAPSCGGGGSDQWAVSASTTSGSSGTAATTTQEAWAEENPWYGYICDSNSGSASCNDIMYNGLHEVGPASATSSPFVVNHRPTLTAASDTSPTLPGATTTWSTTSDDPDSLDGDDTIQLHVCKAQDFDATVPSCGIGGFWASSTFGATNVSAEGYLTPPLQDKDYPAYVYLVDEHGHPASGGWHSSSTILTVANATPYVSSSSIQVYDVFGTTTSDQDLALVVEEGETQNFVVEFQVTDDNSCEADGGGDEITGAEINVFRYNDTDPYTVSLTCDASGDYNANYCYTHTSSSWSPTCYQVPGDCAGPGQAAVTWECTFPMWYIADPTDGGSQFPGHDWRASARATDDDTFTSPYSTFADPADGPGSANMTQFLSFRATGSPIAYGSWEPGQDTGTHIATTTVYATGNTGLDHYLSGDAMCETYPACSGLDTDTIYVPYQSYATTSPSIGYGSGTSLSTSTSPVLVNVDIRKPQSTSTPADCTVGGVSCDDTYWGIEVPNSITYAGDYIGRNYIDAAIALSGEW